MSLRVIGVRAQPGGAGPRCWLSVPTVHDVGEHQWGLQPSGGGAAAARPASVPAARRALPAAWAPRAERTQPPAVLRGPQLAPSAPCAGIDLDDARRKREDNIIQLRKDRRDENLQKKRMVSAVAGAEGGELESTRTGQVQQKVGEAARIKLRVLGFHRGRQN